MFFHLTICFSPSQSPEESSKYKIKVWELICLIRRSGLRTTFGMDKAIAHTKGYVGSQLWLYIPTMWCHCHHLHSKRNFARIQSKKIISITPFSVKSFLTPPLWWWNSGVKVILFSETAKHNHEKLPTDAGKNRFGILCNKVDRKKQSPWEDMPSRRLNSINCRL